MSSADDSQVLQALSAGDSQPDLDSLSPPLDPAELAQSLWRLARGGHAPRVVRFRSTLARMQTDSVTFEDFVSLLEALAATTPPWVQAQATDDGLAYPGWSFELERLFRRAAAGADLQRWAATDLPEPLLSSFLFALGRHGASVELPASALSRFAHAFLLYGSSCEEQFDGWPRVYAEAEFGRAIWSEVDNVQNVAVKCAVLDPLVPYATGAQIKAVLPKLVWKDPMMLKWRAAFRQDIDAIRRSDELDRLLRELPGTPEPLPAIAAAMSASPKEETDRVAAMLSPMLGGVRPLTWRIEDALAELPLSTFPTVLRVTAGRLRERNHELQSLCTHFRDHEHLPFAAAFFWCDGGIVCVATLLRALGERVLPALLVRYDEGWLSHEARIHLIEWVASHAVVTHWDRLAAMAGDLALADIVVRGLGTALRNQVDGVNELLRARLDGPSRSLVLRALSLEPQVAMLTDLEAMSKARLSAADKKSLRSALSATRARARYVPSDRGLELEAIARLDEPIESLWVADGGDVVGAVSSTAIHLFRGEQHVVIAKNEHVEDFDAVFMEDGSWLVVTDEEAGELSSGFSVYRPFEGSSPLRFIEPIDGGLAGVLALADGIVISCSASKVEAWCLEDGSRVWSHRANDGSFIALVDDERYLLAGGDDNTVELRSAATGKRIRKLPASKSNAVDDWLVAVTAGDSARIVVGLWESGAMRIWDIAESSRPSYKDIGVGSVARSLEADSKSSWIAVPIEGQVRLFNGAESAGAIAVAGEPRVLFWRPGVAAILSDRLDVWELDRGHLGSCDDVVAMATGGGRLVVATRDGMLHRSSGKSSAQTS